MFIRIFITVLLSIFSTIVMSYIALAASIGPWIETTLVLCSMFLFHLFLKKISTVDYIQSVGLSTAAGGIGGILATGLAFSFPTLYFLSPTLFESWLKQPLFFSTFVTSFCFVAGAFGLLLATIFEDRLLIKQQMKFPIGELVYNAIAVPGQLGKSLELACGFFITQFFLCIYKVSSLAEKPFVVLQTIGWSIFSMPALVVSLEQLPMYVAVGFVTGHVIAFPLITGFLTKILILDPLFYGYTHVDSLLYTTFFKSCANIHITSTEFVLAFCSGMVLYGALIGFFDLFVTGYKSSIKFVAHVRKSIPHLLSPKNRFVSLAWLYTVFAVLVTTIFLYFYNFSLIQQTVLISLVTLCSYVMLAFATETGVTTAWGYFPVVRLVGFRAIVQKLENSLITLIKNSYLHTPKGAIPWGQVGTVMSCTIVFLYYCNFTFLQQLYLVVFSAVCIYQMLIIAGKIGIIPLGRFATFVMVPGMLLFNFDFVQITLVAAFVEIAGGVAGDVLFGRRLALLANIKHERIVRYQWLGLIVCCLVIGILFWLFITTLGIGQDTGFPATKAASRALLIAFKNFDWYILGFGFVFGYAIKYLKVNPALLLGGILMPPSISLMLIAGGLLTYITNHKERYYPFFSGVSAGSSIWMVGEILAKLLWL